MASARGKKKDTFALVDRHRWFLVDRVVGSPGGSDQPWFIGIGVGFDIRRILVYARDESGALEIAEEKYPDFMGSKVAKRDEAKLKESDRETFFSKGHMWVSNGDDVRIFTVAERVEKGTTELGGDARLSNGEMIRYT